MTHYYITNNGGIYSSYCRHEKSWTITSSSKLKDTVSKPQEIELSADNQKLDSFLKSFATEVSE